MYPSAYREAIGNARVQWNRYRALPHWRLLARRKADAEMRRWIALAIKARHNED